MIVSPTRWPFPGTDRAMTCRSFRSMGPRSEIPDRVTSPGMEPKRRLSCIDQTSVARGASIDQSSYSRWEMHKRQLGRDTERRIATALLRLVADRKAAANRARADNIFANFGRELVMEVRSD